MKHAPASGNKPGISVLVICLQVRGAVDLDNQATAGTREVGEIWADGVLAPEASSKVTRPETAPQAPLDLRHVVTELAGSFSLWRWH
jgi:hypothetical protein